MDIISALKDLDPTNDSHWTDDGDPRMSAIEERVGTTEITRDDVIEAAPRFCRTNLEFPGEELPMPEAPTPEEGGSDDEVVTVDPIDPIVEPEPEPEIEAPVETEEALEVSEEIEQAKEFQAEIDEAAKELNDISNKKNIIDKKFAEAQKKHSQLMKHKKEKSSKDDQNVRMNYIKRQKEIRMKKVKEQKQIRKALGLDKGPKISALDEKLRGRPRQVQGRGNVSE